MTLSDQFTGGAEPDILDREEWISWLMLNKPVLRRFEAMKEWQHQMCDIWMIFAVEGVAWE